MVNVCQVWSSKTWVAWSAQDLRHDEVDLFHFTHSNSWSITATRIWLCTNIIWKIPWGMKSSKLTLHAYISVRPFKFTRMDQICWAPVSAPRLCSHSCHIWALNLAITIIHAGDLVEGVPRRWNLGVQSCASWIVWMFLALPLITGISKKYIYCFERDH